MESLIGRSIGSSRPNATQSDTVRWPGEPSNPHTSSYVRPDRFASDPGGSRRLRSRRLARGLYPGRRPFARLAALWRALGPALDRHRAYADTAGDNADYPIPEVARYRDYIIDSFNRDKPFDQFVREQLAGDILARQGDAANYADAVVATGFLALSRRYATAPFELWHLTLEDTIETTGRAFFGPHAPVRTVPRPQVRPSEPAQLLRTLWNLRQYELSVCRLRGTSIQRLLAVQFRPAGRAQPSRA